MNELLFSPAAFVSEGLDSTVIEADVIEMSRVNCRIAGLN